MSMYLFNNRRKFLIKKLKLFGAFPAYETGTEESHRSNDGAGFVAEIKHRRYFLIGHFGENL